MSKQQQQNIALKTTCKICFIPILSKSAYTVLPCGHYFHADCAHNNLVRNYNKCPGCVFKRGETDMNKIETSTPVLSQGEMFDINFGTDINVDKDALRYSHISKLASSSNDTNETNIFKELSSKLQMAENVGHDKAFPNENGNQNGMFKNAMYSMIGTSSANTFDMKFEKDPKVFISKNISSVVMVRDHNITSKTLIEYKVNIELMFANGYDITDLIVLQCTWRDLLTLGLNDKIWRVYYKKLYVPIMCKVYNITVYHVYTNVCAGNFNRFIDIHFTLHDIVCLKGYAKTLRQIGLYRENINAFGFRMEEWKNDLHMTGSILYYGVGLEPGDLDYQIGLLKWVDWANPKGPSVSQFKKTFPEYPVDAIDEYYQEQNQF